VISLVTTKLAEVDVLPVMVNVPPIDILFDTFAAKPEPTIFTKFKLTTEEIEYVKNEFIKKDNRSCKKS
jgi:hypothetical protein